jgi:molecular chaperone DnaK
LHVSAKDLGTGKEQKITITASSGLTKEEIERMRKDAEAHAEEDKKRREEIELRNEADNAVYRSEKMLKETGDKLSRRDKSKIEDATSRKIREALKGRNTGRFRSASEKLHNGPGRRFRRNSTRPAGEKARGGPRERPGGPKSRGRRGGKERGRAGS